LCVDHVCVKPSFMKFPGWILQSLTVLARRAEKRIQRLSTLMSR
jgi:hypothetical protein